jgi:hypothetical protein
LPSASGTSSVNGVDEQVPTDQKSSEEVKEEQEEEKKAATG